MLSQELQQYIVPKVRVGQFIAGGLLMGVIMFSGCISLIANWENYGQPLKLLTLIGAVAGFSVFILSLLLPILFSKVPTKLEVLKKASNFDELDKDAQDKVTADLILNMLATEKIVRGALIEGAIFLNVVVFLLEPHLVSLVVVGAGFLLMLVMFPRVSRVLAKTEDRIRDFRDQNSLATTH